MASIESVNVGAAKPYAAKSGRSGIDKHPVDGPVRLAVPPPSGSALAGDTVCDTKYHGGPDQAVYAYAREDLAFWEGRLDRGLRGGFFGENLTTTGVEVTGAVLGETWRVGAVLLQVSLPRIPCVTFAAQLGRRGWLKEFTAEARPGAYLRVLEPGEVRAGDPVTVLDRPDSPVTVGVAFRAVTTEPELLELLVGAPLLPDKLSRVVGRRVLPR